MFMPMRMVRQGKMMKLTYDKTNVICIDSSETDEDSESINHGQHIKTNKENSQLNP